VISPYLDWIGQTSGLAVPEIGICWLMPVGSFALAAAHGRKSYLFLRLTTKAFRRSVDSKSAAEPGDP